MYINQEYHNMCRALEERHEKEKQELNQEVIEIRAQVNSGLHTRITYFNRTSAVLWSYFNCTSDRRLAYLVELQQALATSFPFFVLSILSQNADRFSYRFALPDYSDLILNPALI